MWKQRLRNFFGGSTPEVSLGELKTILFEADLSGAIVEPLLTSLQTKNIKDRREILSFLHAEILKIASSITTPIKEIPVPGAILLLGVNGSGKTTAAARLAKKFKAGGKKVVLAAADTFRAGAVEQLKMWGEKIGVEVVSKKSGADPGAVVFDAWQRAISQNGILIADTAGRLHNKIPLVEELKKIVRILSKDGRGAPHESYLVLDGTTGQNALAQSKEFLKATQVTGLIVTKMDGSTKGGGALSASYETKIPIRYIGVGEKEDDLKPFDPVSYVKELLET